MVVAYLRGVLRKRCESVIDYLAEDAVLNSLEAEIVAGHKETSALMTASALSCFEAKARSEIMSAAERNTKRASQLRRLDFYDATKAIGLRGFGAGQNLSLVKLFQLAKKHDIIKAVHESCQRPSTTQE